MNWFVVSFSPACSQNWKLWEEHIHTLTYIYRSQIEFRSCSSALFDSFGFFLYSLLMWDNRAAVYISLIRSSLCLSECLSLFGNNNDVEININELLDFKLLTIFDLLLHDRTTYSHFLCLFEKCVLPFHPQKLNFSTCLSYKKPISNCLWRIINNVASNRNGWNVSQSVAWVRRESKAAKKKNGRNFLLKTNIMPCLSKT